MTSRFTSAQHNLESDKSRTSSVCVHFDKIDPSRLPSTVPAGPQDVSRQARATALKALRQQAPGLTCPEAENSPDIFLFIALNSATLPALRGMQRFESCGGRETLGIAT
jgi:hypothetical protein